VTTPILSPTPTTGNGLLDAALAYAGRGWSILPVRGKRAAVKWTRCQTERPDPDIISGMFRRPGITGLAVITGAVSGGLAIRDYDQAGSYDRWADVYRDEAGQLPTVQTARGYHVYGRLDTEQYVTLPDGELRADSCHYVVLPPSRHPDGGAYQWMVPLPPAGTPLPLVPASLTQQQAQADPAQPIACVPQCSHDAILATLPTGPGQRNRRLFELARRLKGTMPNADADTLRAIVREWHRLAQPVITTKDLGTTWADFGFAWQRVRYPAGQSFGAGAAAAENIVLAGVAAGYDGDLRRLAQLCAALQAQHGDRPFFLGCRQAGDYLGVPRMTAWRLVQAMTFDGVLLAVRKGTKGSGDAPGKASEWRFDPTCFRID
jgi:hypothetical protein